MADHQHEVDKLHQHVQGGVKATEAAISEVRE